MLYLYSGGRICRPERESEAAMIAGGVRNGAIDRLGICVSGLCVVHCIASAVWVAMLASAGGVLL